MQKLKLVSLLSGYLVELKDSIRETNPALPSTWLVDENEFIEWVCRMDAKMLLNLFELTERLISEILSDDEWYMRTKPMARVDYSISADLLDSRYLLTIADDKNWDELKTIINVGGKGSPLLATILMHFVLGWRLILELTEKETLDQLYVVLSDLFVDDVESRELAETSLYNLIEYAENTAKKELKRKVRIKINKLKKDNSSNNDFISEDNSDEEFMVEIVKALMSSFKKFPTIKDKIIAAAEGDKGIKYVPKRIADRYKSHLGKPSEKMNDISLDSNTQQNTPEYQIEYKNTPFLLYEEFSIGKEFKDKINKMDPTDQQILNMKKDGYTIREISAELSISKSTVSDRLKVARKILTS